MPIASLAMMLCERSTSKPSRNERLLAASKCPATRCIGFLRRSRFLSDARSPLEEVCLTPPNPPFSIEGSAGCWNGSQLYAEAKALGYTGSQALFRLFMASLRKPHQAA
jgi:hypothetical protein